MAMLTPVSTKTPAHPLSEVIRLAGLGGQRRLAESESDWRATGLEYEEVFEAVQKLKPSDFVKSDPSKHIPGTWLDVYNARITSPLFPRGVEIYCKVTISDDKVCLTILSFKEK